MDADVWRILGIVFLVATILLFIAVVVLYKALRIRDIQKILSGRAQSEEIEQMRHSRWGTWGTDDSEERVSNRSYGRHARAANPSTIHEMDDSSGLSSMITFSSDADMDEGETTLAPSRNTQLSSIMDEDEGETTLAQKYVDDEGVTTLAKHS
ncbi:hypothetical protein EJ419_01055 [Alloscardovia theropitheci]|uniref:Uncharacterized protein n=1 Tax=Alloscardovia theropitheci TaxID=2496842 RepID=A0A4R0QTX7_9BIFI|nr:hypothetical protein [Alloscardovia theropitheci]TCD55008.1 hypothetical protein EJ419_01055 [Alloscardovia theropitheci]